MLTLVTASVLKLHCSSDSRYLVEPHNPNQSGASSREVSDLDAYHQDSLFALFELKDKNFSVSDVRHAVKKAQEAQQNSLNFVYGRHSDFDRKEVDDYRKHLMADGFILNVVSVDSFIFAMLTIIADLALQEIVESMIQINEECRFSADSTDLVFELSQDIGEEFSKA